MPPPASHASERKRAVGSRASESRRNLRRLLREINVERLSSDAVRVLATTAAFLLPILAIVVCYSAAPASAFPDETNDRVRVLVRQEAPSVRIVENGRERRVSWTDQLPLRFISYGDPLFVDDRAYRGEIIVERSPGARTVRVINELGLEDYLRGVIPAEMPATWPAEALMAQAVAARTYAVHAIRKSRSRLSRSKSAFDLNATMLDQVYLGFLAETEATDSAVRATMGRLLEFESSPILAYFHSTCGGVTEIPGNVWGSEPKRAGEYVYRHVEDSWCTASPYHDWRTEVSPRDLRLRLAPGVALREILSVRPDSVNASGRVQSFTVEGTLRTHRESTESIAGQAFRMLLGPSRVRSLRLGVEQTGDTWVFTGSGWGHGVGLCQWGARGLAEAGYDYREILEHYYPGAIISGSTVTTDSDIPTIIFPRSDNYSLTNISITP